MIMFLAMRIFENANLEEATQGQQELGNVPRN